MSDAGLTFGVDAEAYERGRPEWPEQLLDALPLGPDATVVDLGAGTGKLTRVLAARYATAIAVEPDGAMRALIGVGDVRAGAAEAIPVEDASVDAVFAAEAFHWFDPAGATDEVARVLRPGGVLALLWNDFSTDVDVLPDGIVGPGSSPRRADAQAAWHELLAGRFEPLREARVAQQRDVPRAELLDYFASISPVTALPPDEREHVLERVAAALDRPAYTRRWTAELRWTRKRA